MTHGHRVSGVSGVHLAVVSVPGRPPAGGGVGAGHGLGGGHEAAGAGLAGQGAPVQPGRGRGRPARTRHRRLEQVGGEAGPGPAQ